MEVRMEVKVELVALTSLTVPPSNGHFWDDFRIQLKRWTGLDLGSILARVAPQLRHQLCHRLRHRLRHFSNHFSFSLCNF